MLDLKDQKFNRFGNANTLKELVAIIKNNRIIPFIGAGMSIDIYGAWDSALKRVMEGHIFEQEAKDVQTLIENCKYEDAAEKISGLLGVTSFQDQLVAVFGEAKITDDALKKMAVRYLPRIFKDSLVVTTNFDKVLERAFLMEQQSFVEKVALRHLTNWQAERSQRGSLHYLIKIHGCVSAPDEVVLTKASYDDLYSKNSSHIARLRRILGGNNLLFIGCGLKEDRTVELLREVGLGGHYAILEMNGQAGEDVFKQRKRLMSNDLKMHCIWYPKGEHHYVEDILEYIYTDITGQVIAVESYAPKPSDTVRNPNPARTKKYVNAPQATVQPTLKPLIKNEIYTMGLWNNKPLEWIILDVEQNKALLIAKDCLLQAPYNEEWVAITWEQSSLRNRILPQLLEQIFDDAERDRVLHCKNENANNKRWKTQGGDDTDDKLFLLSVDEVNQYFPYDDARIAYFEGEAVWWWLRSPCGISSRAASVYDDGIVFEYGYRVSWSGGAVRPAFWLNLKS